MNSQIMFNLIGNAVIFTDKGSVEMETVIIERDSDKLSILFVIQDTGIGMSFEQQIQILDPCPSAAAAAAKRVWKWILID